jgi:hypothetical protein
MLIVPMSLFRPSSVFGLSGWRSKYAGEVHRRVATPGLYRSDSARDRLIAH